MYYSDLKYDHEYDVSSEGIEETDASEYDWFEDDEDEDDLSVENEIQVPYMECKIKSGILKLNQDEEEEEEEKDDEQNSTNAVIAEQEEDEVDEKEENE